MADSNYHIALLNMRKRFLSFDQQPIIEKFSLSADETYIYLPLLSLLYRIHRATGLVEYTDGSGSVHEADFNAAASIYDVLCCSKPGCSLSGQFAPINSVAKNYHTKNLGGSLFDGCALFFAEHPDRLEQALLSLGGTKAGKGDIAYCVSTFPFLPIQVQFWESDDEFPASLQLLWDLNTLDYLHYETTYYLANHLLQRLRELMEMD